jgi:hypothetical protein
MRAHARFAISLALAFSTSAAAADDGWVEASKEGGLTIYNRQRAGSEVKELRSVGVIDAPPWVCMNVVSDEGRFKDFMPYTAESKVLVDGKDERVVYQRIDAPFVSDRDYTIRIRDVSSKKADGRVVYKKVWSLANDKGPAPKDGVVRLAVVEGFWQFEELAGGEKTRATYYVFTDPGGSLPAFVINGANKQAIPGLYEAVGKQAKGDRYRSTKPYVPGTDGAPADVITPAK